MTYVNLVTRFKLNNNKVETSPCFNIHDPNLKPLSRKLENKIRRDRALSKGPCQSTTAILMSRIFIRGPSEVIHFFEAFPG